LKCVIWRDANPIQNSGWFGLWVSKICYFGFGFRVPGFQKSNSGFGFGFRVRKFPKKSGFGFRFGLGFVKNIKIPAKFPQKNYFSYILRRFKLVFVENNRKNWKFLQKLKENFSKLLNMGLGSGTGFLKNQTRVRVRVLGLKIFQKTGFWVRVQNRVRVRLHLCLLISFKFKLSLNRLNMWFWKKITI
jgi:hypothetical protein